MNRGAESAWRRASGKQLIVTSAALGGAGILPLLLYVAFGPADGNPIGLGLLAVAAIPLACVGILAGLVKLLVELSHRSGR
jgi:hypothetical protein